MPSAGGRARATGACGQTPRAMVPQPLPEPQPLQGGLAMSEDQVLGRWGAVASARLCSLPPLGSFPLETQLLNIFQLGFHNLERSGVQFLPQLLGPFLSHSVEGDYQHVPLFGLAHMKKSRITC